MGRIVYRGLQKWLEAGGVGNEPEIQSEPEVQTDKTSHLNSTATANVLSLFLNLTHTWSPYFIEFKIQNPKMVANSPNLSHVIFFKSRVRVFGSFNQFSFSLVDLPKADKNK